MGIFNKILISIKRNWGKSLLFLIITMILGSVVFGAMVISQAVFNTEMVLRRNLPPIVTIEFRLPHNMDLEDIMTLEPVTLDHMREIGELPYVSALDYSFHQFGIEPSHDSDFRVVKTEHFDVATPDSVSVQYIRRPDFIDLNQGLVRIVDGRTFTNEEMTIQTGTFPVLISAELADINNLSVGKTFNLDSVVRGEFRPDGTILGIEEIGRLPFEFQIIGIFEIAREFMSDNNWRNEYTMVTLLNRLYTPAWTSLVQNEVRDRFMYERYEWWEMSESTIDFWIQLAFTLYDPLDIAAFEEAALAMLPEFWEVITLADTFAPMTSAMMSINWMAEQLVYFVIIIAVIVLTLLIVLVLHERRHEVGIYLALGEKKWKIIIQMMSEVIVNAIVGIVASILIGNLLAQNFSEQLLVQELASQIERRPVDEDSFSPNWDSLHWFSTGNITLEETMELHEISIDVGSTVMFVGGSVLIIVIVSVVPIIYLTKISPKKVLL